MADLKNDIEKYLRNELSPAERHALEKKALSDPFLADALEGGESFPDFSTDVQKLNASLNERINKIFYINFHNSIQAISCGSKIFF